MATGIVSPSSEGHTRATAGREGGRKSILSVGVEENKRVDDFVIFFFFLCV